MVCFMTSGISGCCKTCLHAGSMRLCLQNSGCLIMNTMMEHGPEKYEIKHEINVTAKSVGLSHKSLFLLTYDI